MIVLIVFMVLDYLTGMTILKEAYEDAMVPLAFDLRFCVSSDADAHIIPPRNPLWLPIGPSVSPLTLCIPRCPRT